MEGKQSLLAVLAVSFLYSAGLNASAQVSITALQTTATENFNGIGNNAASPLPSGWRVDSAAATADYSAAATATTRVGGTENPGNLTSTSDGGTYNLADGKANGGNTERAVGWLSGGASNYATNRNLFVHLVNNTGSVITRLTVGYDIEKYRNGQTQNTISFFGGTNGSVWTSYSTGDHTFPADANNNVLASVSSVTKSVSITGLNIANGSSYYLRWNYNGLATANGQALGIDNFSVTASGPSVAVSATNLTFGTVKVGAVSGEQSYTVSGSSLSGPVTLNAPSGFEVSTSSGSGFGSSLELTPVSGTLDSTTIYARFAPVANGAASGNITHSSPGAGSRSVAVAGTGDSIPPSVSISAPSASVVAGGSVSYTVTYTDASAVTLQEADVTVNQTGTTTATVSVSGTGTVSRTVTLSGISGNGTLGITIAAGTAADAVGNLSAAAGPSATFTVDNTPPSVTIGSPSPASTVTGPVSFSITYGGASSITLSAANVSLIATGTATGSVAVSGTGTTNRTVTVSGISGNGTLAIAIAAGTASDAVGNLALAAGPGTAAVIDTEGPAVSFGSPSAFYVSGGNVTYRVFYSDASEITLSVSDIIVHTTGTATATAVVEVGGGPNGRNVRLSGLSGDGEISISVKAGTAVDSLGNLAPAAGPSLVVVVDNTPPQMLSAVASTTQSIDVTFSERIDDATATTASFQLTGAGMGSLTSIPDTVTALTTDTYRLTWNGELEMRQGEPFTLAAPAARDLAGNLVVAPGSADGLGLGEPPVVESLVPVNGQSVDITFNEPVDASALDPQQYTAGGPGLGSVNANPDSVTPVSGNTYRLGWSSGSMANGEELTVVVGNVSDVAGNPIDPSNSTTITALPVAVSAFTLE